MKIMSISGHDFVHAMTAKLSWHVQNCDLIGSLKLKLKLGEISKVFSYELINHSWNDPNEPDRTRGITRESQAASCWSWPSSDYWLILPFVSCQESKEICHFAQYCSESQEQFPWEWCFYSSNSVIQCLETFMTICFDLSITLIDVAYCHQYQIRSDERISPGLWYLNSMIIMYLWNVDLYGYVHAYLNTSSCEVWY